MQVDRIKLTLEPTGPKRLKLKCDDMLSISAFKFNLRRYIKFAVHAHPTLAEVLDECFKQCHVTGPVVKVGWCTFTLSSPVNGAWNSTLEPEIRQTAFKLCYPIQLAPLHQGARACRVSGATKRATLPEPERSAEFCFDLCEWEV